MQFYMPKQKHGLWCWAAATVSIEYWMSQGDVWKQCEVAHLVYGGQCCPGLPIPACCVDPGPPACNQAASLADALAKVRRSYRRIPAPLSREEIKAQIDAGRPIGVRIGWRGGSGHFVVIRGYSPSRSDQIIDVADSFYGQSHWYYAAFRNAYQASVVSGGGGIWTHSYLIGS